ncbi:hypothetical protein EVC12_230 [Rhizobium phage RHph_I42]|nr:hypothetical protein EVC12_230 [Rhizobium phage RHph_I42]
MKKNWQYPNIIKVKRIRANNWPHTYAADGKWAPARPISCRTFIERVVIAWRVFRGQYDALDWS